MSNEHRMSKTQYLKLQGYLYDLHNSGKVCVFARLSGHVNWLEIDIATSKESYNEKLYGKTIRILTDYKPTETDKELVDEIIAAIEDVVNRKEEKIAELEEARESAEKARYEELKARYEEQETTQLASSSITY